MAYFLQNTFENACYVILYDKDIWLHYILLETVQFSYLNDTSAYDIKYT